MNERGYTLLELMVVIAIVLVAGVAVVGGVASVRKASLTTSAARVAASIRYLYDLAVLNNRPYRLVIDLDGRSFYGETVSEPCTGGLLPAEEEVKYGVGQVEERKEEEALDTGKGMPQPGTRRRKENLLKSQTLPKGISFAYVVTSHNPEPVEQGQAEIFFFPDGYVEKALIYLAKGDDVYTVETVPLRGKAIVHTEEVEAQMVMEAK